MAFTNKTNVILISVSGVLIIIMVIVIVVIAIRANRSTTKTVVVENTKDTKGADPNLGLPTVQDQQPASRFNKPKKLYQIDGGRFNVRLPGIVNGNQAEYTLTTNTDLRKYIKRGDPLVVKNQLFVVCDEKKLDGTYKFPFSGTSLPLDRSWRGLLQPVQNEVCWIPPWLSAGDCVWRGARGGTHGELHPDTKEWRAYQPSQVFSPSNDVSDVYKHELTRTSVSNGNQKEAKQQLRHPAHYDRAKPSSANVEAAQRRVRTQKGYMQQKTEALRAKDKVPQPPPPNTPSPLEMRRQQQARSAFTAQQAKIHSDHEHVVPTTPASASTGMNGVSTSASLYNNEMMDVTPDAEVKHHGGLSLGDLQKPGGAGKQTARGGPASESEPEAFTSFNNFNPAFTPNSVPVNATTDKDKQTALSDAIWDRMRSSALRRVRN